MSEIKLTAERRTAFGKGAARRIRRDHKIPAVLYGHGTAPVHITLPGHDTMMALKTANALLSIELDGESQLALAKDVQRDPIKPIIEHVDLVLVRRGEKVTVDVPVHTEGEAGPDTIVTPRLADPAAARRGHPRSRSRSRCPSRACPRAPRSTPADVALPEGAELVSDPETLVVNVTAMISEEALEAELGEAAPAAEAEAADGDAVGGACWRRGTRRGLRRVARAPPCRRGSSSGSATPGLGMPEPATTSAPSWCASWLAGMPVGQVPGPRPSRPSPRRAPSTCELTRRAPTLPRFASAPQPGGAPGPPAVLAVPTAYMNESGGPVKALLRFYGLSPERLVVVHDEMDIAAGTIRLKRGGGEGGHNGLRSVSAALGTRDYLSVRVGIGRPPGRMDPTDYLLHDFGKAEREQLPFVVGDAAEATVALVTVGLVAAQQLYHIVRSEKGDKAT